MHPTPKMQPRSFGPLNPPFYFIIFYHLPSTGCDSSNVTFFSPLARGFLPRSTASSNHRRVWVQLHQEEPMEAHGPFHRIHRIRVARRKARRSKPGKSIAWKMDGKWMDHLMMIYLSLKLFQQRPCQKFAVVSSKFDIKLRMLPDGLV